MRHFSFVWVAFTLAASVAAIDAASAGIPIYDWQSPGSDQVLDPRELGAKRVLVLVISDRTAEMPITRLGTFQDEQGGFQQVRAPVECGGSFGQNESLAEQIARGRLRDRSAENRAQTIRVGTGALVNADTVVLCRPRGQERRPRPTDYAYSYAHHNARIRICVYEHEPRPLFSIGDMTVTGAGVRRERVDLFFSDDQNLIAGVSRLSWTSAAFEVQASRQNLNGDQAALLNSCPTMPSVVHSGEMARLVSARLVAAWDSIPDLRGPWNLMRPVRGVIDAVERNQEVWQVPPIMSTAWTDALATANAAAEAPYVR